MKIQVSHLPKVDREIGFWHGSRGHYYLDLWFFYIEVRTKAAFT